MAAEAKAAAAKAAGEAAGGVAEAISSVFVAQQQAIASIEKARQETKAEAVKSNSLMLHELDRVFLTYETKWGRRNKETGEAKHKLTLDLSILDMYAMGDLAERLIGDLEQLDKKAVPTNMTNGWLLARAPLVERTPYAKPADVATGSTSGEKGKSAVQAWIEAHPELF